MLVQFAPLQRKHPKRKETSLAERQITLTAISLRRPTVTYLSWTDIFLLIDHTFCPLLLLRP